MTGVVVTGRDPFPIRVLGLHGRLRDDTDVATVLRSHRLRPGVFHGVVELDVITREGMAELAHAGWKRLDPELTLRQYQRQRREQAEAQAP